VESIRAAGRAVAAVVLNQVEATADLSSASNGDDLRAMLDVPVVRLGHIRTPDGDGAMVRDGTRILVAIGVLRCQTVQGKTPCR
jgi:hypothetical protein